MVAGTELETTGVESGPLPAVEGTVGRLGRRRRLAASVVVLCAYAILGIVAFWPDLPHISGNLFSQATLGDPQLALWLFAWVQHALLHGFNPFFSHALFVPHGLNLGANTAAPVLALLTLPLAPFLGPVTILNLLTVAAMPISAAAAFFVLRKWKVWLPAAAIGGLVYGFAPNMVGQNLDLHISLTFLPFPPLIAATGVSLLQGKGAPWRLGLQLGVLIAAQYLTSPEVAGMLAILGIAGLALVVIRRPSLIRERARRVAPSALIAGGVTIALLAYPAWMLFAGPQHVPGPPHALNNPYNKNDLLNFVVPGPTQRISFGMTSLSDRVDRLLVGENSYIGIPVLLVLGYLVYRSRRVARVQLTLALLVLSAVLTLGPHLVVAGHSTRIPLPFLIIDHLPSLNSIIPPRFAFGVDACLAALIAFSLDEVVRGHRKSLRHGPIPTPRMLAVRNGALAVGVLLVLVVTQLPRWPYGMSPATSLPTQIRRAIPAGDPVALTYPYTTYWHVEPMVWQVNDGFDFRLVGGYGYQPWPPDAHSPAYVHGRIGNNRPLYPPPMTPAGLQQFLAGQEGVTIYGRRPPLSDSLVAATRATLSAYKVKVVIVDGSTTGAGPVAELFRMALGPPTATAESFVSWDVRS